MIQESRLQEQPRTTETRRPAVEYDRDEFTDHRWTGLTRVTWSAVIAGAIAAMAAQVLFAALGLAIGLSLPGAVGAEGIGIFAGIWWLVTGLIALFIGGFVAGRFTGTTNDVDTSLHGVMTWALATTLSVIFVTTFGGVIAGGAVGAIANNTQTITTQTTPQGSQPPATEGGTMPSGEQLADTAAGGAWWTFFALLLGLVAAGAGGFVATPRDIDADISHRPGSMHRPTSAGTT